MKTTLLYIPGLGDGYDKLRAPLLKGWRRSGYDVHLVSMHWTNQSETMDDKLARIERAIDCAVGTNIVLIGESAGGAMALVAYDRFCDKISRVITLCGMNQGHANVSPHLYKKNPAFRSTMQAVDEFVGSLSQEEKSSIVIVYSPADPTVRPRDTLLPGVNAIKLPIAGHFATITYALAFKGKLFRQLAISKG